MKWSTFVLFISVFLASAIPTRAQDSPEDLYELQERIKRLERRIQRMEKGPTAPAPQNAESTPSSSKAEKSIPVPFPEMPRATGSSADSAFATATGLTRTFNPAISVNGLFLGTYRSIENNIPDTETKTGLDIQEMELQFTANVDTYLRANFRVSFEDDEVEIEESFVDLLLFDRVALRAGQFYTHLGKHNLLHTHQFPFIDVPLVNREIFGAEALLEIGVGLSYLMPLPWYSEWVFEFVEGDNSNLFDAPLNDDFAYILHSRNLWDLNEDTTMEIGGSYSTGRNGTGAALGNRNRTTQIAGGNLTLKWKPARQARYKTLVWQSEYIRTWKETGVNALSGLDNPDDNKGGMYSYLQYQFAEQWWIQARYGYFGFHQAEEANDQQRTTLLLGYVPSEFSAIRLQYSYIDEDISNEHQVLLQLNFSLGSHPAHRY